MKRLVRLLAVVAYNGIARHIHAMVPGGHQARRQLARLMCARVSPTASIEPGVRLSRHLYLGDRTGVGADTWFIGAGDIVLGHRLRMGPQCLFITNDHRIPGDFQTFDDSGGTSKSIIVGDDVFIGARTTVLGGVEIGQGAAIGAGSVVTRSIPAGSVAAGNPAAVIRSRAV